MKIKEVVTFLKKKFPLELADDFDNNRIGFIIGSENIEVKKVLLTLDLNLEVVEEAIKAGANFIISHHPYLFNPITKLLFDSEQTKTIEKMLVNRISLYSMHTNFDVGTSGVNDTLISLLECKNISVVNDEVNKGNFLRYGNIDPMKLGDLITLVKEKYHLNGIRYVGNLNSTIKTVGVIGGAGGRESDISLASNVGCDCYITGEVRLSAAQYAQSIGISLIEVNHGVEKLAMYPLAKNLKEEFPKIDIIVSSVQTDPLKMI